VPDSGGPRDPRVRRQRGVRRAHPPRNAGDLAAAEGTKAARRLRRVPSLGASSYPRSTIAPQTRGGRERDKRPGSGPGGLRPCEARVLSPALLLGLRPLVCRLLSRLLRLDLVLIAELAARGADEPAAGAGLAHPHLDVLGGHAGLCHPDQALRPGELA